MCFDFCCMFYDPAQSVGPSAFAVSRTYPHCSLLVPQYFHISVHCPLHTTSQACAVARRSSLHVLPHTSKTGLPIDPLDELGPKSVIKKTST
jgi:hypothetical protein